LVIKPDQGVLGTIPRTHGDELLGVTSADLFDWKYILAAFPTGIGHELLIGFLLAVTMTLSALMTTTKSPASSAGCKPGYSFRVKFGDLGGQAAKHCAIASTTCHLRSSRFTFGKNFSFKNPEQRRCEITKEPG